MFKNVIVASVMTLVLVVAWTAQAGAAHVRSDASVQSASKTDIADARANDRPAVKLAEDGGSGW